MSKKVRRDRTFTVIGSAVCVAVVVATSHVALWAGCGLVTGDLFTDSYYLPVLVTLGVVGLGFGLTLGLVGSVLGMRAGSRGRTWVWWAILLSLMAFGSVQTPDKYVSDAVWIWWPALVAPPIAVETVRAATDRSAWRVVLTRPSTAVAIVLGLASLSICALT